LNIKKQRSILLRFNAIVRERGLYGGLKAIPDYLAWFFNSRGLSLRTPAEIRYVLLILQSKITNRRLVQRRIHGNMMFLDIGDVGLSRQLLLDETREPLQTQLVKELLRPGMVVAEVGANLGYYLLIEASLIGPKGKIYAVEPVPANFDILNKNIALNHYKDRVESYLLAISDENGVAKIATRPGSNQATMFLDRTQLSELGVRSLRDVRKVFDVRTATLDDFLDGKRPVDFIRMDVEGHELHLIKGMQKTLAHSRVGTIMFMETHPVLFKDRLGYVQKLLSSLAEYRFVPKYLVAGNGINYLELSKEDVGAKIVDENSPGLFVVKV
jgi:FkbM family methyltransferase